MKKESRDMKKESRDMKKESRDMKKEKKFFPSRKKEKVLRKFCSAISLPTFIHQLGNISFPSTRDEKKFTDSLESNYFIFSHFIRKIDFYYLTLQSLNR